MENGHEPDPVRLLNQARARIATIDDEIIALLEERMTAALKAGRAKEALGRDLHVPSVEDEHIDALASKTGLSREIVKTIFSAIMAESLELQKKQLEDDSE